MDALQRSGIKTQLISIDDELDTDDLKSMQVYGIFPLDFNKALTFLKSEGKKIVYDTDDAYELVEESNPFYYAVKRDIGSAKQIISLADHITVATPKLAEYMKERTDKPITIVPNCFTSSEWNFKRPKRAGVRIGFAGSSTHLKDLLPILPIIEKLQKKYDFTFILFGFNLDSYQDFFRQFSNAGTSEANEVLIKFDQALSKIKFEWVTNVPFNLYPQVLTNISLDIGLCPLISTPFDDCRSASKAMEYTLSGALALASDVMPYQQEPTSVLVNDWAETLEYYITHPTERELRRLIHLKWIQENRDIDTKIDLLKSIYDI